MIKVSSSLTTSENDVPSQIVCVNKPDILHYSNLSDFSCSAFKPYKKPLDSISSAESQKLSSIANVPISAKSSDNVQMKIENPFMKAPFTKKSRLIQSTSFLVKTKEDTQTSSTLIPQSQSLNEIKKRNISEADDLGTSSIQTGFANMSFDDL